MMVDLCSNLSRPLIKLGYGEIRVQLECPWATLLKVVCLLDEVSFHLREVGADPLLGLADRGSDGHERIIESG